MNQYMLDYSNPDRQHGPDQSPNRGFSQVFWQMLLVLGGWVIGIGTMGVMQLRTQTSGDEQLYKALSIQYDSLLAAKLETDRQLEQLRRQIHIKTDNKHE